MAEIIAHATDIGRSRTAMEHPRTRLGTTGTAARLPTEERACRHITGMGQQRRRVRRLPLTATPPTAALERYFR